MTPPNTLLQGELSKNYCGSERRAWLRFPCNLETSCTPVSAKTAKEWEAHWPAKVCNISADGVGLLLRRPFEPGTLLTLTLQSADASVERTMLVRVLHLKSRSRNEWLAGCAFVSELSDSELQALV